MSSDNGVYLLQTEGPEYRVVYSQGIDNIYGKFNDETNKWDGNPEAILDAFGKSEVFTDIEKAWDYATTLAEDYEWLEDGHLDGVCLIRDFSERKFSDVIDGTSDK